MIIYDNVKSLNLGYIPGRVRDLKANKIYRLMCKRFRDIDVELVPIKVDRTQFDNNWEAELTAIYNAFNQGLIDICITDGVRMAEWQRGTDFKETGIITAAILKRQDPREVLITPKKNDKNIISPLIYTNNEKTERQYYALYSEGECINKKSVNRCLKALANDECNGVMLHADDIRELKRDKISKYRYDYYEYNQFVPTHGRAFNMLLTVRESKYISLAKSFSDKVSAEEYKLEKKLRDTLLDTERYEGCEVETYVSAQNNRIVTGVYISKNDLKLKVFESGAYENRNLVIQKTLDRVYSRF